MRQIACAIFALSLFACSNGDALKSTEASAPQNTAVGERVFDMNEHQFAAAFNDAARSFRQPFRIDTDRLAIKTSAIDDYFQQQFLDDSSITVAFSKDSGRISSITILIAEKNGDVDMHTLATLAKIVMHTTSPELSREKIARIVADMIHERTRENAPIVPQRYFDQARYTLRSNDDTGFWWIANPV
jgi:hypothetical protein